jgi:cell division protein FtsL
MKKILLLLCFVCITISLSAQVVQQKSNKYQLQNGIKLDSEINTDNLVKVKPTTINISENTSESKLQPIKKEKLIKPVKVLKYGIKNQEDE